MLQVVQRVITRHLLDGAQLRADEGHGGAVKLIQRFGSAANLNMHLCCLVLDGVYRCGTDDVSNFVKASAPTDDELHALLHKVITQLMKMLVRRGVLVEGMGQTHLHEFVDAGERARTLRPLQAAVMPCRARRARGRALRPAQIVHRTVCVRAQHHALGHEPAGVHVASGRAGAATAAAPDPFRCPHKFAVRSERTPAARTWGVGPEP